MDWPALEQIKDLARLCATVSNSRLLPWDARYEAAFDAIVQAATDGDPRLKMAGFKGIARADDKERSNHGLPDRDIGGERTGQRFQAYWHTHTTPGFEDGFSDRITDDIAIRQVWNALPERHQGTISALIHTHGNVGAAAAMAGVPYPTYAARLMTARGVARRLWYDSEHDPGHYKRYYASVHERTA